MLARPHDSMEGRSDADKMGSKQKRPVTGTISRGLFNDLLKDLGPAKRKSDLVNVEIQGVRNDPECKLQLKKRDSIGSSLVNSKSLSTSLHSLGSKLNLGRMTKQTLVSEGSAQSGGRSASSLFVNRLSSTSYSFAQLEGSTSSRDSYNSFLGADALNSEEQRHEGPVGRTGDTPDSDDVQARSVENCAQLDVALQATGCAIDGDIRTMPTHKTSSIQRKGSRESLNHSLHSDDRTTLKLPHRTTRRSVSRGPRRRSRNVGESINSSDFSSLSTVRRDGPPSERSTRPSSRRQEGSSSSLSQGPQGSTSPRASRSLSRKRGISSSRRRRDGISMSDGSAGLLDRKQPDSITRSSDNISLIMRRQDGMSSSVRSTGSSSRKLSDSISRSSDHISLPRRRLAVSTSTTTLGSRPNLGQDGNSALGGCRSTTSSRSSQSINSLKLSRHQKKSSSTTRERPPLQRSSSDDSRLPLLKMSISTAGQRPSLERSSSIASLKPPSLQRSSSHSSQRPSLEKSSSHSSKKILLQMSMSTAGQRPSLERSLSNTSLKPPSLQRSSSHASQRSLLQKSSTHSSKRSLLPRATTNLNQRASMQKSSSNRSLKPLIDLLEQGSKQQADPIDSADNESWCTESSHDVSIRTQPHDVVFQSLPDLQSLLASDDSTSKLKEGGTSDADFNVLANASWDYGVLERNVNGCRYPRGVASTPPLIVLTDRQKHIMASLIELEKGISVEYKQNPKKD